MMNGLGRRSLSIDLSRGAEVARKVGCISQQTRASINYANWRAATGIESFAVCRLPLLRVAALT